MVLDAGQAGAQEGKTLLFWAGALCLGQFLLRIVLLNSPFTTLLLVAGMTFYTVSQDHISQQTTSELGIRALCDVIGFLVGAIAFMVTVVVTATQMAFTADSILEILLGTAGLAPSAVFLSLILGYFSNLALFSLARFVVHLCFIPVNFIARSLGGGGGGGGGGGAAAAPAARRGRGRPRLNPN